MTPAALLSKWRLRFRDNDKFEISEADLREFTADLTTTFGGIGNEAKFPLKVVRALTRTAENAGAPVRDELKLDSLCIGTICYTVQPTSAEEWQTVLVPDENAASPYKVWRDASFEGVKVSAKWVSVSTTSEDGPWHNRGYSRAGILVTVYGVAYLTKQAVPAGLDSPENFSDSPLYYERMLGGLSDFGQQQAVEAALGSGLFASAQDYRLPLAATSAACCYLIPASGQAVRYTTLDEAQTAASNGDTLYLVGLHVGYFTIYKNLTLAGPGYLRGTLAISEVPYRDQPSLTVTVRDIFVNTRVVVVHSNQPTGHTVRFEQLRWGPNAYFEHFCLGSYGSGVDTITVAGSRLRSTVAAASSTGASASPAGGILRFQGRDDSQHSGRWAFEDCQLESLNNPVVTGYTAANSRVILRGTTTLKFAGAKAIDLYKVAAGGSYTDAQVLIDERVAGSSEGSSQVVPFSYTATANGAQTIPLPAGVAYVDNVLADPGGQNDPVPVSPSNYGISNGNLVISANAGILTGYVVSGSGYGGSIQVVSGGGVDLSNYYTKAQSDERYAKTVAVRSSISVTFERDAEHSKITGGTFTVDASGAVPGVVVVAYLGAGATQPTISESAYQLLSGSYESGKELMYVFHVPTSGRIQYLIKALS